MEKRLTADLNVVANSNLEIELLDGDLNIIQKLDDEPNDVGGLTSAELKAKFDESGNIIKKYINETLIPAVLTDDATEESRKQAEAARVAAEQGRVTAEEGRVSAEAARAAAEQARSEAEASRVSAENAREAAETARADETAGIVARATAQANAAAGSASQAAGSEQSAKDAAGTATGAASSASQSAAAASGSASQASAAAAAAAQSAANGETANKNAQSWAVGGTGTRPGEDTNNAKYWAEHAEAVAGGDFATKSEAQGYVTAHNENVEAHHDLRVAVAGSVRYDAAQTLTDEQKAQARGNIGAVDSASLNRVGTVIGLCGWNQIIPTKTSVNSETDTSNYLRFTIQAYLGNDYLGALFSKDQSTPGKIVGIFTSNYDCNKVTWNHNGITADIPLNADSYSVPAQIKTGDKLLVSLDILSANPTVVGGLSVDNQMLINLTELFGAGNEPSSVDEFRAIFGATYYPYYDYPTAITKNGIVEYLNPPMGLGIEYRTTERYLGKPVYVKTINMGNLPGNAVKQASFQSNNVVDKIVSVTGQCTSDSGVNMSLPYHAGSGPNWNTVILIGATGVGTAQIVTFAEDFAGYTDACITVKYTKLAD